MDFAVIICAYSDERFDDLVAAIHSVQTQTLPAREIVVVVDHNPALFDRVRQRFPDVVVVENRLAPGAGCARNTGVAASRSRYIAFLDDDAQADPGWLANLAEGFQDGQALGVGGVLLPRWKSRRPPWFPAEFNWVVGCSYTGLPEVPARVRNLIAANMSVRRDVFNEIGGFRVGYGNVKVGSPRRAFWVRSISGDEETELCIRALKTYPQGYWWHCPRAIAMHNVPVARTHLTYYLRRCYDEGVGKALLSRIVGVGAGLSAERTHVVRTLPRGVWHGVQDAVQGDLSGLGRAAAIVVGLIVTTLGYLIGLAVVGFAGAAFDHTQVIETKPLAANQSQHRRGV